MIVRKLRLEWRGWWAAATPSERAWPALAAAIYLALNLLLGGFQVGHAQLAATFLSLWYLGPRTHSLFRFFLPMLIVAAVYDGQRYWVVPLRGAIHVRDPYLHDLSWFGIRTPSGAQTPAEWFQEHTAPALDLLTGLAYLLFIPVFLGCAAWWKFHDHNPQAWQAMWSMLVLNLTAYAAYLIYPAAPPWFAASHGLGPAAIDALPESGGALRFDQLLRVHIFANTYAHNTNVFGAIPSLHVGQTFLATLFAWRFRSLRVVATLFWLLIAFSSVYLNHHYVWDGLYGMIFALGAVFLVAAGARAYATKRGFRFQPEIALDAR